VINAVEATNATAKIIILDACRNNPFYRRWGSTSRGGSTRGLAAPLTSGKGGTLIAFSTAPGKEAADGGIANSPNSPFTTHLLRHLRTPNLEVSQLFRKVRVGVVEATRSMQTPWVTEALVGEVYLNPNVAGIALAGQSPDRRTDATRSERDLAPTAQPAESAPPPIQLPAPLPAPEPSRPSATPSRIRGFYALQGHKKSVYSVAFSPDGSRIISRSIDNTIRISDSASGKPLSQQLQSYEFLASVSTVAFSPDGRRIVSGSVDKTIRIWDAASGKPLSQPLQGHKDAVRSVAFSPDGRRIVSGSSDNTIRIWDAASGKPISLPLKGHTDWVWDVAFSPDGRRIVSGSSDDTIRIWDAASGKPLSQPLQGHTDQVNSVAFSPDGRSIVSGSRDDTLRIWDATSGKTLSQPLRGHTSAVNSVAFSPDGRRIVSGSIDGTIRIWDAASGAPIGFAGRQRRLPSEFEQMRQSAIEQIKSEIERP
jgi:WD40 repeat protein